MAKAPPILQPMLASLAEGPLADPLFAYEPKYDGIRAIAEIAPHRVVRLWSRLGNEKTAQFPEIAHALEQWATRLAAPIVLDGEIVALDAKGDPAGFGRLQGRIHLLDVDAHGTDVAVAFVAFDILRDGQTDLRHRPFHERRTLLERVFSVGSSPGRTSTRTAKAHPRSAKILRVSDIVYGDGRALYAAALAHGWEGVIAKQIDSRYQSGKRTPDWRKLKIVHEQEFVVGGWTEPRHTRSHFGALLLGVYEASPLSLTAGPKPRTVMRQSAPNLRRPTSNPRLIYVGHTGTGFDGRELARVMALLEPLETTECPFRERPRSNERPHWVRPMLVAQVKFSEWTADGSLRHPVYLGLRDDKKPTDVVRETVPLDAATAARPETPTSRPEDSSLQAPESAARNPGSREPRKPATGTPHTKRGKPTADRRTRILEPDVWNPEATKRVLSALRDLEDARRDGVLSLPDGQSLSISNLHKVFWPKQKLTKGDLFRYYAQVAPFILPAVADRPLVMKRFPNGIAGKPFYQHRAPDVPPGARVETPAVADGIPQIIGGTLTTLLYTTQLAAISQDPWLSRVQSVQFADHVVLDLDPPEGVPFERVLDVARWIRDELDAIGAEGVPKTSGADGLHVYIPLPPETPYDAGLLFCQIVATVVTQKHPKVATVERHVRARGPRVYVDYLQNILGKTLATAYSARASSYAGVSTPLTWQEVDNGVRREDFTIETIPSRLAHVGDLWARLRHAKGVDLSRALRYAERTTRKRSRKDGT